jgi:hypothetical protein
MQDGPKLRASLVPLHFFIGLGLRHLRLPTGGAAKGMPLKLTTVPDLSRFSIPLSILTVSSAASNRGAKVI